MPEGDVALVDILDTYPFVDELVVMRMTGAQIRRALEQSLTLERGLLQVSGLEIVYDLSTPERERLVSLRRKGRDLGPEDELDVAVSGFLAEGGDLTTPSPRRGGCARSARSRTSSSPTFVAELVKVPPRGRQVMESGSARRR